MLWSSYVMSAPDVFQSTDVRLRSCAANVVSESCAHAILIAVNLLLAVSRRVGPMLVIAASGLKLNCGSCLQLWKSNFIQRPAEQNSLQNGNSPCTSWFWLLLDVELGLLWAGCKRSLFLSFWNIYRTARFSGMHNTHECSVWCC